jgi:hypothetical protein
MPRVRARERDGDSGRERECVSCPDGQKWQPLSNFARKNGYLLRSCKACRLLNAPIEHERHGAAALVPSERPHLETARGRRSLRLWFDSRSGATATVGRYWDGALVSSSSIRVPTPARALRIALNWLLWVNQPGEPAETQFFPQG